MDISQNGTRKRGHSATPPWERRSKDPRASHSQRSPRSDEAPHSRFAGAGFAKHQKLRNQMQEDEQMRKWVAQEDDFVLNQSKKKAKIRVREGRARVIDWLAVTLSARDQGQGFVDDEPEEGDAEIVDPSGFIETLDAPQVQDLTKDIDTYLSLEKIQANREYWNALKVICNLHELKVSPMGRRQGTAPSISVEIEKLLQPKSHKELEVLEKQVKGKFESDEPIDIEYWENLLGNVKVFKAKAELKAVYQSIVQEKLRSYQRDQLNEASDLRMRLRFLIANSNQPTKDDQHSKKSPEFSSNVDPQPALRVRSEDKALKMWEERDFVESFKHEKDRISSLGYVPASRTIQDKQLFGQTVKASTATNQAASHMGNAKEDSSSTTNALYEREVARGIQDDEEIFAGEEEVAMSAKPLWAAKYRPRKPRYFNRVQMGYEWNKYNQTHYDHENPPPKIVQGYKFNVFYPDLIDKIKAPSYRIEREGGRKRGEISAPAGEEDTCLIRFVSGPPYEDIAFRIVDKEWDFSAKRERGFRSSFDKGILQLHFQFKKVYYRK